MKRRNLFLSLICSILVTAALVVTTIVGVVPQKKKSNINNQPAGNVSDTNQNVSDEKPEEPKPEPVFQDGSKENPYIITDVESFFDLVGDYGYTSGKETIKVPAMEAVKVQAQEVVKVQDQEPEMVAAKVPVMVPSYVPALTEKMVESYDKDGNLRLDAEGNPIMVIAYDKDGNVIMTEKLDAEGNIIYTEELDADGNVVMTEKLDADGNVIYTDLLDENGNVVMTEKLDENGNIVMKGKVDENGDPIMIDKIDENGNVVMQGKVDENGDPIMIDKLDEEGKVVLAEKLDKDGNVILVDKIDEDGNIVYITTKYFVLANDIDFADVDFVTLFGQDKPFNGVIDGKGFALKNISINVTIDNIKSFVYQNKANENRYDAHIAVFGTIENAEIKNLKLDNISVVISEDVHAYIANGDFAEEYESAMNEISVGTLAAIAKNSTVKVDVLGSIVADGYSIYTSGRVQGNNAVGGVVAVADGLTISDSKIDVDFTANPVVEGETKVYAVGGVAGYAVSSTIKNVEVNFEISSTYKHVLYVGGVAGYMNNVKVDTANVNLSVNETAERKTIKAGDTINAAQYTWVGGVAAIVSANSAEKATELKNIIVVADVDIDVIYAGAVVEIWSTATEGECVVLTDIVVDSNVNTLQAFGFVKAVANKNIIVINLTKLVLDETTGVEYNVKITGTVKMTGTSSVAVASFITHEPIFNFSVFKVIASQGIYDKVQGIELFRKYGNEGGKVYKV